MSTSYIYDVFISYRRSDVGKYWVPTYFEPCLRNELDQCLGKRTKIFFDTYDIGIGAEWPARIKEALARSKCLVPVLCGIYFTSDWCTREFAAFYQRQLECNQQGKINEYELIKPVLVRNGNHLPEPIRNIQNLSLQNYWTKCESFRASIDYMKFENEIKILAESIAGSINRIPEYNIDWANEDWMDQKIFKKFHAKSEFNLIENPVLK